MAARLLSVLCQTLRKNRRIYSSPVQNPAVCILLGMAPKPAPLLAFRASCRLSTL